jgi:uncharacterized spore protein YtfJ
MASRLSTKGPSTLREPSSFRRVEVRVAVVEVPGAEVRPPSAPAKIGEREADMDTKTDVRQTIAEAKDAMSVKRVFGDPLEKNGVTVIPAARIQGGAGGGGGEGPEGQGSGTGSGFGMNARPAGAFVIKGDEVDWRPAIDVNRVILGGQLIAIAALLLARAVIKARASVLEAGAADE